MLCYLSLILITEMFSILRFRGRQSNVSMTIVVFISRQFHSHVRSSLELLYDKVICNFAEMEGYYVEKTWSVFESHSRNTVSERKVCEEGGVSIVRKQN